MIIGLLSVVIGVLLLGFLFHWAIGGGSSAVDEELSPIGGSQALHLDLPSAELIERILDPRDLDFVSKESTRETVRLFERERRALAISWLQQTRRQVVRLMRYHVGAVRQNANFRPAPEIKLALHYVRFLIAYELVRALFYAQSPFQVRPLVAYVTLVTERICGVSDKLLGELSAAAGAPPHGTSGGS
ncbi:MAG TPA: hypothetical protein VGU63_16980 [Candidatus Acidoferrales bacterium]|nr:hypothetical protein [Candidatus Acidoferrales bacterium]